MHIDSFTFVAEILNFALLVYLLKRFLYGPVVQAMDERQASIAATERAAVEARSAASLEAEALRLERGTLEARRDEMLAAARQEADERRKALLDEARAEAEAERARWNDVLRDERVGLMRELRERAAAFALAATRKVLEDLAGEDLDVHIARHVARRFAGLGPEARGEIGAALGAGPVVVRSASPLPEEAREAVARALSELLAQGAQLRFEVSPALTAGIEIGGAGAKVAWSVADYLRDVEEAIGPTLAAEGGVS